ncbi:hypothetical protein Sp245p_24015 (plasmid) [Azospirillum baldaniorum]|uniref:Filamentous haemagglutinin FhaB/tRNA nuclease CdiA-like TPS domain-containing protein n=1 Tax=Azospirillum baldaniorum TaxID=1064539 RepID=A0A9P1NR55_9PROT|nr:filamentous hemagglutinin N-terminal domain-containing protein [Azospirillum baldaniorum]AWJ92905.1 hypothetical protein Sp245p_24015 [Azospirillum baldaniorum]TWA76331.1 filamentous hemagglutinin family protein [Azospirillum brasilense]CCD02530.1 exported protein of unknown function [Azospirillum baldaniorum]
MTRLTVTIVFFSFAVIAHHACADVVTDGTMGPLRTLSGSTMIIPESLGTRAGPNLFHSFEKFEVRADQAARFRGGEDVQRVITRVTGKEPTRIYGNLSSDIKSADLYMINPNGIVVGPTAAINVSGAFHAATAGSIAFPDGKSFAANGAAGGALSIAAPESFGFVGDSSAIRIIRGSVTAQRNISLIAPLLDLDGAAVRSQNGQVAMVAPADRATVRLEAGAPSRPTPSGSLSIARGSQVSAERGAIRLEGGSVSVDGSTVEVASDNIGPSGGITVVASDLALSAAASYVGQLSSLAKGKAAGGPIRVTADTLTMTGGRIAAETIGSGTSGEVAVDVAGALRMSAATISGSSALGAAGAGGTVAVTAGSIHLDQRSGIGSVALGAGRGGSVSVTARDSLTIVGSAPDGAPLGTQSGVFALSRATASGDGGNIVVRARDLQVSDFGQIAGGSFGTGAGGSVDVVAGSVRLSHGGTIGASAGENAVRGGSVSIRADRLWLHDGAEVTVRSRSAGVAGDLMLSSTGPLTVDRSTINASADRSNGGNVLIEVGGLFRLVGGRVSAAAGGLGGGGNIIVSGRSVVFDDSRVVATAVGGDGGAIRVASQTYHASPDSLVSASSAFGFDGTVRLETPLFGRFAPAGNTSSVQAIPPAPTLTACDQGGRTEEALAHAALTFDRPPGHLATAFPVPGERLLTPGSPSGGRSCGIAEKQKKGH